MCVSVCVCLRVSVCECALNSVSKFKSFALYISRICAYKCIYICICAYAGRSFICTYLRICHEYDIAFFTLQKKTCKFLSVLMSCTPFLISSLIFAQETFASSSSTILASTPFTKSDRRKRKWKSMILAQYKKCFVNAYKINSWMYFESVHTHHTHK